jgi:cell division protein FtsW
MSAVGVLRALDDGRRPAGQALPAVDPWLAGSALALLMLGIVVVASASMTIADRQLGNPFYYVERQAMFAVAGLAAAGVAALFPLRFLERLALPLLAAGVALLTVVLVPGIGREVNGATRWIELPGLRFQPSEVARLCFVVWLASYLARHAEELRGSFKGFLKPLGVLAVCALLLIAEPDFGAVAVLFATALAMLFVGGVRLRDFLLLVVALGAAGTALALAAPYRVARLTAFMNPWADPFDTGFQLTQSLIAIGRGEWFGVGLGQSVQKLFYLPEAHTDFVFAVFAEEFGFAGTLLVIGLYALLVARGFIVGRRAAAAGHAFGAYLAFGVGAWLGLQAFVNIGVNMGLLPTKGLTLPLMSSGGSSLIVTLAALGLVVRVGRELRASDQTVWARKREAPA